MLKYKRAGNLLRWFAFGITVWFTLGVGGSPVVAQPVSDGDVERRLAFIEERLDASQPHTEIWQGVWTGINGGAAVGLAAAASLATSNDDRINFATMSVVALIGLGDQYLFRTIPGLDGALKIRMLPNTTPEERREKLKKAELMLQANADREAERTSWTYHAGNAALNGLAGAVIGIFANTKDGIIGGATGFLGGIVYAFSEPWGRQQDWQDYERLRRGLPTLDSRGWSVIPLGGGLALRYQF